MLILPETPRYHIKTGNQEKAAKSLSRLRRLPIDHPGLVEELAEVRANHEFEMKIGKGTYADCFKGTVGKRLMTGCLLQALQQLSGVNFIFYYGTAYFTRAGFQNPFIIQVITNTVNVVCISACSGEKVCAEIAFRFRPCQVCTLWRRGAAATCYFLEPLEWPCVSSSSPLPALSPAPRICRRSELPLHSFAFTFTSLLVPGALLRGLSPVSREYPNPCF
jgi:Sugar (and other) transporter